MADFNHLPRVRGDTDDEASIHPFRQVGPAQPLPNKRTTYKSNMDKTLPYNKQNLLYNGGNINTDRYISQLMNESSTTSNNNNQKFSIPTNNAFGDFRNSGKSIYNYESDIELDSSDSDDELKATTQSHDEPRIDDDIYQSDEQDNGKEHLTEANPYISDGEETARESEDDDRDQNYKQSQLHNFSTSRLRSSSPANSSKPNQPLFQQLRMAQDSNDTEKTSRSKSKPYAKSSNEKKQSTIAKFLGLKNKNDNPLIYGRVLFLSFVFSLILILVMSYPPSINNSISQPIGNFKDITSRFQNVESRVDKLTELSTGLTAKQQLLEARHDSLTATLNTRFNYISTKFEEISQSGLNNNSKYEVLLSDIDELKSKFNNFETLSLDPEALNPKLNDIASRLDQLSRINETIESIKSDIFSKLIASLPGQVPVYIKDNKIHYIPEFHKYLYNFIESYYHEKQGSIVNTNATSSWDAFITSNGVKLSNYIDSTLKNNNYKTINREAFEKILHNKLTENNRNIWQKFNNLIDNLNINANTTNIDITKSGNKILLDNLLDIFAKGSIKINYADYNLGSRILGFLTNTGSDFESRKSLPRKLFLGWYDYLSSNGLRSPKNWKFNANNLLLDGGDYWQCQSNICTFGVRLFNPVILTDIILKTPLTNVPESLTPPNRISIYVKPKNPKQVNSVLEYLNKLKINFKTSSFGGNNNKYLTKFIKIKEVGLDSAKPINHIKLPISLINLRVPVKDIYIEISSRKGTKTGGYSFKAYGISEYNSYKYSDEFDLLLNKLYDQQQEESDYEQKENFFPFVDDALTNNDENNLEGSDAEELLLGDDEIIF